MTTPDHAENTGDNLRHAAEVQEQARADDANPLTPPREPEADVRLPDFNT